MNVPLTNFLVGRFNRISLRDTLDGMTVSDLLGMTGKQFLKGLTQKDQHIGRILWTLYLEPIRTAYAEWEELREMRSTVETTQYKLRRLIEVAKELPPAAMLPTNP